ncbi:MAG: hypothetical protein QM570_08200 [Planctomycetota bacterium]|nr:hypothetical protein [Planctomycetota bacterium]
MYFDWCENPEELRKAIGDLLSGTTFVRATMTGPGAHAVTLIGPNEDGILKQAFLEARNVAEKLCKRCPALPALPDTLCVPLEGIGRMLAWCREAAAKWVEPAPNTAVHMPLGKSEDLISKAGKVHELLVRDSAVRERFREQDRLFWDKLKAWWQANEAYEAALRPFSEKVYRSKGKNKAKAEEELERAEANLQPPGPCPVEWLQPPVGWDLPPNARNVMKRMFPDSRPPMTEETVRLRAYVLLTILHDHALKNEVSLIADEDVWPRDDDDMPGDFALTAWKDMEANPSWLCGAIDRALHVVEADLDGLRREPIKTPQSRAKNWAEISIEIIDEDTLKYKVEGGAWERVTYAEMGFVDRRKALPNKLWGLFKTLAMRSTGRKIHVKTPTNISKDMDRIRCTLRRFFGLTGTPIRYNKRERTYDTKFNLKDGREGTTR